VLNLHVDLVNVVFNKIMSGFDIPCDNFPFPFFLKTLNLACLVNFLLHATKCFFRWSMEPRCFFSVLNVLHLELLMLSFCFSDSLFNVPFSSIHKKNENWISMPPLKLLNKARAFDMSWRQLQTDQCGCAVQVNATTTMQLKNPDLGVLMIH